MKQFWNIFDEKHFAPLRILNSFIKSFVNPFLTFLIGHLIPVYLNVLCTKLAISLLLAIFTFANIPEKNSNANLLNSWVIIYLSWSWTVVILFSTALIFVLWSDFLTELLTSSILFPTALQAAVVA